MPHADDAPRGSSGSRSSNWRSKHRSRAHDSAHADAALAGAHPAKPPPEHPLIPAGAAALVTQQDALLKLVRDLRAAGRFAYDSEFIGELTYLPKLCLIQVASPQQVALIDPLAELDLAPFWELLNDPAVEKVVHAGQQDIEPVYRHTGRPPANFFDTQIAAGFIGMAYPVALGKLVHELVGVRLGKGLTLTHWDQRPLSSMQLRYAADDVRYLLAVRQELGQRLDALGHAHWAQEECQSICESALARFDPEAQYLRIKGAGSLSGRGLAILRELTIWRDGAARAHDVPPRSFLRDEILLDMARSPVDSLAKLQRVRGLPRPVEQAHGAAIVEAVRQAAALPQEQLPQARHVEESPTERFRADALWAALQCLAIGQSIDPALISSRQEIGELNRALTSGGALDRLDLRLLRGWRRQAVGQPLLDVVQGQRQFSVGWANGALRTS